MKTDGTGIRMLTGWHPEAAIPVRQLRPPRGCHAALRYPCRLQAQPSDVMTRALGSACRRREPEAPTWLASNGISPPSRRTEPLVDDVPSTYPSTLTVHGCSVARECVRRRAVRVHRGYKRAPTGAHQRTSSKELESPISAQARGIPLNHALPVRARNGTACPMTRSSFLASGNGTARQARGAEACHVGPDAAEEGACPGPPCGK